MKIKSITLFNIGPYVNANKFEFTLDKKKNIVLIGGKNGAGKTTFFKAIKTCLYGCKVWGFDAPGKEYYSIISSLVNFKTAYDSNTQAYIDVELVFDDGKKVDTYILHRGWKRTRLSFSESFYIEKNGKPISESEEENFVNYLLSIIPPDMFNFYFFDGESIAEFFLGADGNRNFRNAFLKLYGLDTLSILVENFARNIKKTDAKNTSHDLYKQAEANYEAAENHASELAKELNDLENKLDLLQIQLHSLHADYSKEGGVSLSEWKEINARLSQEESRRDELNRWLKDAANHYIPFILLEKNLHKLLYELNAAQENQKTEVVLDTMSSEAITASLNRLFESKKIAGISAEEIINVIKQNLILEDTIDFDYSTNQINRIISHIYEKLDFDKASVKIAVKELDVSLRQSKKLRDAMMNSSVDGYESFVEEKEKTEKQISDTRVRIEQVKQQIEQQQQTVNEARIAFEKVKATYESILKNKSVTDLSERAVAAYSLLEEQLVQRQAERLQKAFVECFTSIINKDHFIDGILIDKNINIIPYKYITVSKAQMTNYLQANREFLNLFGMAKIKADMNRLEIGELEYAAVPAPIKSPFSQGERQVYIMSVYLALLKTSRKDIPFFVDTPFARIDSDHREKIITEFFITLKNQLFVLSTDEEIVGVYKEKMSDCISDKFTLQINDYGTTRIIPNEYFGE